MNRDRFRFFQSAFQESDLYIGVPAKLGSGGVEEVVELKLDDDDLKALQGSAAIYKETIGKLSLPS